MTVNELLEHPFCATDCDLLKYIYDWAQDIPDVLEPLHELRNRVAMNDVKDYLNKKSSESHTNSKVGCYESE